MSLLESNGLVCCFNWIAFDCMLTTVLIAPFVGLVDSSSLDFIWIVWVCLFYPEVETGRLGGGEIRWVIIWFFGWTLFGVNCWTLLVFGSSSICAFILFADGKDEGCEGWVLRTSFFYRF